MLANTGEGLDAGTPAEQRRFFSYAMRSAGEGERLVGGLERLRLLPERQTGRVLEVLFAIKMDLLRLIRWTWKPQR